MHASVLAALLQANSAAGPDHLPGGFFRMLPAELAPSLAIIFQQSCLAGRIPDKWRFAKKGRRDSAVNYRPISLFCVACKIMESFIRSIMCDYLINNDLSCHLQHGFRNKQSTISALLISQHEYINSLKRQM